MPKLTLFDENIIKSSLEDVMHESFIPYAEYVILERALPRVEDGLKPVQRRILYTMNELQIYPDSKYKKCARIVGETMGKYHPHGDTSIYEALARMAQDFSMRMTLVDGQGNFGSQDGDSPAAMRYTEARMAPLAMEMLRDIDKDTVEFGLNFDDTMKEPLTLPSRYPNLLVNGAKGIAVGLATNIPPHNLAEVIDGTVLRLKDPKCTLDDVMQLIKAPDFPTGGSIMGSSELKSMYETGKGKIYLRAVTHMEKGDNGRTLIVIDELPFEVKESDLLRKIDALRETKKEMFAGIDDVRSESDRQGIRAVVSVRRNADAQKILDCLLKYSDLQVTYGANIVAIAEGQPKQLGLLSLLDYYIGYQRKIIRRRTEHDLEKAQEREHILAGLIIAVTNIDEVIKIIRSSKNSREAKQRLMAAFDITGVQAQAILDLRLARLTALEVETLKKEYADILKLIEELESILASKTKLDGVIIKELGEIKKKYASKRRTSIEQKTAEIKIDVQQFKAVEDCVVVLTRSGNLKRMSKKAFQKGMEAGEPEEKNKSVLTLNMTTDSKLWVFTDMGNLYSINAETIREAKYKDAGAAFNTFVVGVEKGERIIHVMPPVSENGALLFATSKGMVKKTAVSEFDAKKTKITACGLKEGDKLISVELCTAENLLLITQSGMSIVFGTDEIAEMGRPAKGVGGIKLGVGDSVICAAQTGGNGNVVVVTDTGYIKSTSIGEYDKQGRNGKGLKTINLARNGENGMGLAAAFYITKPCIFTAELSSGEFVDVNSAEVPMDSRNSKGVQLIPALLGDMVENVYISYK